MARKGRILPLLLATLMIGISAGSAFAEDAAASSISPLDTVWVLLGAFLVIWMNAGFAMVETGFCQAKNAAHIIFKNFIVFGVACLSFFFVGYALMFGSGNGFMGFSGFGMGESAVNPASNLPILAFWLFQAAFCGTAATIVSGAMAERMRFDSYLIYAVVITGFTYPVIGHWIWGGGWLAGMGFHDFAGSTVVHTVGGVSALAGVALIGPRYGKYNGTIRAIPGHNIPLAALGVFILWLGWFGFNPGSNLGVGDGTAIARIAVTTNLAACAGSLMAMLLVWKRYGKPDLSMAMNGALAGLVAITAPCAVVSPLAAIVIGGLAGLLVALAVPLFDKLRLDDPVGAISVHGVCGIFGTLAVGIWGQKALGCPNDGLLQGGGLGQLGIQILGSATCCLFTLAVMGTLFAVLKATIGLRVTKDEELRGLDIGEHGMEAYAGFQFFTMQ